MPRIGLVLGAGGAVGQAYHAGVLAALNTVTGWDPRDAEILVGTSAGSVIAASLRMGLTAADAFARACGRPLTPAGKALLDGMPRPGNQPVRAERNSRIGPSSPRILGRLVAQPLTFRPGVAFTALLPEGRRDTSPWFAGFASGFPDGTWPKETTWICAVSLDDGRRVTFGAPGAPHASIAEAVQASCAIPAVFQPATIGGIRYVDGGVHSPTNADLLVGQPLDAVIVSSPMSAARSRGNASVAGRTPTFRSALRLPTGRMLMKEIRALRDGGTPVLAFEPTARDLEVMGYQPMDFGRRRPVAEAAFESARGLLDGADGQELGSILTRAR